MRATAPNADLRPFHHPARSASSAATSTVVAPWARPISLDQVAARRHRGRQAVDLGQEHGRRLGREARVHEVLDRAGDALVHHLQRGGHEPGGDDARSPPAAASRTDGNPSSSVATAGGSGVSRTAIRVAMPSVPSLPTNAPRRS